MKTDTPVRNTLTVLAAVPVLLFLFVWLVVKTVAKVAVLLTIFAALIAIAAVVLTFVAAASVVVCVVKAVS